MDNNNKSLQFELWQECNSLCTFCFLRKENLETPVELKIESLQNVIDTINNDEILKEYQILSFIGGEFFQGQLNTPEVYELFMKLMRLTAEKLEKGIIKQVWIYATMNLGKQKHLFETLELFKNNPNFWILTSYDTIGRFHNEKMRERWIDTVQKIHQMYPNYKLNTTMILTGDLIDKYLNDEFSFNEFTKTYKSEMFFKQCGTGEDWGAGFMESKINMNKDIPNFIPTRKQFLEFLVKFIQDCPHMYDKLFNIQYRADVLIRNFNYEDMRMVECKRFKNNGNIETDVEGEGAVNPKCGHMLAYSAYVDSTDCCVCDKFAIKDSFQ